jgi:SAM-dependent methyltransferase
MDLSERGAGERRHPWEIERFRAYRDILADHGALSARRVLDVGAGDGWFAEELHDDLPRDATVFCWDVNYSESEPPSTDPRITRSVDPPAGEFDLALVLDVLEHVDDPVGLIDRALRPVLPPGTPVLFAVPAHPALFSSHDVELGHHRRYRRRELRSEIAGLVDIVEEGPLFVSLIAPRAVGVSVERLRARLGNGSEPDTHGIGSWHGGTVVTKAVSAVLAADARATRWGPARRLPGLSTWAFGRVKA